MLRVGTILHGTYRIDSYLSSGGFGNTYIATNIEFDEKYAIKEFFMRGVTQRDDNQTSVSISNSENIDSFLAQREKFKKEARRLRQLNNPHIVKVYDLFDENGTSYYVMDYIDGVNLDERLKLTGRAMTEKEVNMILPQILDALKYVHDAGMWHLDLKPANIMLERGGNIKLIDFGASKQLNAQKGGATTSTAITYTNGYAPREQMEQNYDKFGPWTDIYALGATLYTLLSNRRPPLPTDIDDDITTDKHEVLPLPDGVSPETKSMLLSMLNTNRTKRPQSILALNSYKSKDEEPFRDLKLQTTPKSIIDNDEEATVIAKLQSNKEEKKVEHKPGAEHEHRAASQTSNTYTSQSQINNDNETLNKGIISVLMIVAFVIIVIIILNNYGGSGNYVQDANAGVANIELNDDNSNNREAKQSILSVKKTIENPKVDGKSSNSLKEKNKITEEPLFNDKVISQTSPQNEEEDDNEIYEYVDENAQFPGGEEACFNWLSEHIKYPSICVENRVQGRVIINFVVNTDGSIVDVKTISSPDPNLSQEAERVVKMMPKWKPAHEGNRIVRSRFTLPISFRLNSE